MGWSINEKGSAKDVRERLKPQTRQVDDDVEFEAVRDLLCAQLEKVPDTVSVVVDCQGSLDDKGIRLNINCFTGHL